MAFVERANAVCIDVNQQVKALAATGPDAVQIVTATVVAEQDGVQRLQKLSASHEASSHFREFVRHVEARLLALRAFRRSIEEQEEGSPSVIEMNRQMHMARRLATSVGLTECPFV